MVQFDHFKAKYRNFYFNVRNMIVNNFSERAHASNLCIAVMNNVVLISGKTKMYLYPLTKRWSFKSSSQGLVILPCHYYDYRWSGDSRSQGTSWHGADLVVPAYIIGSGNDHDDVIKWKHFSGYWTTQRPVTRGFDVFRCSAPKYTVE